MNWSKGLSSVWTVVVVASTAFACIGIPIGISLSNSDLNFFPFDEAVLSVIFFLDWIKSRKDRKQSVRYQLQPVSPIFETLEILSFIPFGLIGPHWLRIIKLLKIVSVFRTVRIWRLENLKHSSSISLVGITSMMLLSIHWLSCGWLLVRGFDAKLSYLSNYIDGLYWCIVTISTVGYGDITPVTAMEKLYSIVTILIGLGFYGFLIGNIASLLSRKDPAKENYLERLEQLSLFSKYRSLPVNLEKRIYEYFTYKWHKKLGYNEHHFLKDLPTTLKTEVAIHLKGGVIDAIPLFNEADEYFKQDIALHLKPMVLTPGDFVFKAGEKGESMFFIIQGTLKVFSPGGEELTTLGNGDFFGEIALFTHESRTASIRAETFCDLYELPRDTFEQVLEKYPHIGTLIRKQAEDRYEEEL